MTIHSPLCITSRLLAGIKLADGSEISIKFANYGQQDDEGRYVYRYYLDMVRTDGATRRTYTRADIRSGVGRKDSLRTMLGSLLAFLGAAAEAQDSIDQNRDSDNADLFPPYVRRWAQANSDEIGSLQCALEYGPDGNGPAPILIEE